MIGALRRRGRTMRHRIAASLGSLPLPGTDRAYRRFLIVSPGRAGSNMLVERCDSHPDMICFAEVLHEEQIFWHRAPAEGPGGGSVAIRDRDPAAFLERQVWHRYPRHVGAVGFKLLYSQLAIHRQAIERLIATPPGLSVIWLERRDRLAHYVSALNARRSGIAYVGERGEAPALPPLRLDPDACRRFFKSYEIMADVVEHVFAPCPMLRLDYEDLVEESGRCNSEICAFLGVSERPLGHRTQKMSRGSLDDRVANLPELRAVFRGSHWERYLG